MVILDRTFALTCCQKALILQQRSELVIKGEKTVNITTMNLLGVNFLGVIVAAIVAMVLGFIWYIPLFGKRWSALTGVSQADMQSGAGMMGYVYQFVAALIDSYAVALIFNHLAFTSAVRGALWGLLIGVGIVAASFVGNYIFMKRPLGLYLLDAGYQVVLFVIIGAILGVLH